MLECITLELECGRDETAGDVPRPIDERKELQTLVRIELGVDLREQRLEGAAEITIETAGFALFAGF